MKQLEDYIVAIDTLKHAHENYRAALLPHPENDGSVTYDEYDRVMNEALENLEAAVDAILTDVREG